MRSHHSRDVKTLPSTNAKYLICVACSDDQRERENMRTGLRSNLDIYCNVSVLILLIFVFIFICWPLFGCVVHSEYYFIAAVVAAVSHTNHTIRFIRTQRCVIAKRIAKVKVAGHLLCVFFLGRERC